MILASNGMPLGECRLNGCDVFKADCHPIPLLGPTAVILAKFLLFECNIYRATVAILIVAKTANLERVILVHHNGSQQLFGDVSQCRNFPVTAVNSSTTLRHIAADGTLDTK